MTRKITEWFLFSAAVGLFVAGMVVVWSGYAGGRVLEMPDALLGLSFRKLFWLMGGGALGISGFLLWNRNVFLRLLLLAWGSAAFLVYHIGMRWQGEANLFACVGNLGIGIPAPPRVLYPVVTVVLLWLAVGSAGLLVLDWLAQRRKKAAPKPKEMEPADSSEPVCAT